MRAQPLGLREGGLDMLTGMVRSKARIVSHAVDGTPNLEIAELSGVSRPTVNLWRPLGPRRRHGSSKRPETVPTRARSTASPS